jgi:heme ABC exporter ATP-binding subunit CcmA
MMTHEAPIEVVGLVRLFGATRVLDGVSLTVAAGEAVALLGPNGSGKSTLLKIVATLLRPTRGTARVLGHDCVREAEAVRAGLGLIAHGAHVYDDLTALENLRFWATLGGLPADHERLTAALSEVELERHAGGRVRTFSVGMKRRLALARLSLAQPRVLLLDEPFAGLDQRGRKWLATRLEAFKAGGGAVLMATHSFGRELEIADRLAILAGGRVALDTPRAALGSDDVQRLYAAHTEDAAL